jgi:hypothetical protein
MKKFLLIATIFLYSCSQEERIELGVGKIVEVGGCGPHTCAVLVQQQKRKFKAFAIAPIKGDICIMSRYELGKDSYSNIQCDYNADSYEVK